MIMSCLEFFIFDGLPVSMKETPFGIGLVDGNTVLQIPQIERKEKGYDIPNIDHLLQKTKRKETQNLFESHKLIGSPNGLPIYQHDQQQNEEGLDETIYVGLYVQTTTNIIFCP